MKAQWARGPDFAEVAEALGINTSQVLLATLSQREIIVMYTPDPEGKPPIWRAELGRDADDVLVVMGAPLELPPRPE